MGLFTRRVKRIGTDRYRISLPEAEAELLRTLVPQLRELLATGLSENDPSLTRLFPTAPPARAIPTRRARRTVTTRR